MSSLTPNSILPNNSSHTLQEQPHPATSRPISTPPRWNTEGFSRPVMPQYAQRDSYIASASGIWPSPAGRNSSFVTVTTTSPGPPVGKSSPHKTDYISYSPNAHLHSQPSSPSHSTQPLTPARPRHPSISSTAGTQSIHHPLSRTSSHHHQHPQSSPKPSPRTTPIRPQTSRDDLTDDLGMKDDPRSVMTDEAAQAGQPLLGNMMDALDDRVVGVSSSPGPRVIKDEMIRLAPPIWTMARPHQFTSTHTGTFSPRTTDSDQAVGASEQSHDPFLTSTTSDCSSRGRLDRSKVSFPTSRGRSESEDEDDDDNGDDGEERRRSSVSLNEAGGRGSISGSIGSPKQRFLEVEEEKKQQMHGKITPTQQKETIQTTQENTTRSSKSETLTATPDSDSPLEQPKPNNTDYEQSSLPRILKPRFKINFAWDDMTIPSSITIVSTKGEEKQIEEEEPVKLRVGGKSNSVATTAAGVPVRARTSSLSWATGLAIDTASGVAKYGLSYVPGPIRRRALRDRKWASETD